MLEEETVYTSMYSRNAELYHHGIKGQHWGVQNGPPYPLDKEVSKRIKKMEKSAKTAKYVKDGEYDALTLPKGSKVYRYALPNEDINKKSALYIGFLKNDEKNIKSIIPWMANKQNAAAKDFIKYEYIANKDIKVAPIKESLSIQREALKDPKMRLSVGEYTAKNIIERSYGFKIGTEENTSFASKYYAAYTKYLGEYGSTPYKEISEYGNASDYLGEKNANRYSNMAVGGVNEYKNYIGKELAKRGYNAMFDNAMIGYRSQNTKEAEAPLILFDTKAIDANGAKDLMTSEIISASYKADQYINGQRYIDASQSNKDIRQIKKNQKEIKS